MAQRGRPRRVVPVTELELLTIPQALLYLQLKGRGIDRVKLRKKIVLGEIQPAYLDLEHLDNQRRPTYLVTREALDRYMISSLRLLKIAHIA